MRPADLIVRLEWLAVFLAAIAFYVFAGGGWLLLVLLILAPDLSMLDYLAGPRVGAFTYNMLHVMFWPLLLLVAGAYSGHAVALQVAAIWMAHIAIDRALGYGLKYATGFQDTTMGRIGRGG